MEERAMWDDIKGGEIVKLNFITGETEFIDSLIVLGVSGKAYELDVQLHSVYDGLITPKEVKP